MQRGTPFAPFPGVNRATKILLAVLLSFAVLSGVAYVFRDGIATGMFALIIDSRRGVRCSHPELEVASTLDAVTMQPIECSFTGGPLASAQTFTPATIALDGFGVDHIRVSRAVMNFRKRDVSEIPSNTLEDIANITGMRDQLMKAVLDASEMYSANAPRVLVDQLTITRERKKESVIHDFVMTQDGEWNRSRGAKVDVGIEGLAALRNFDRRVTASRGQLKLDLYLGDAERGEEPDTTLQLDGTQLDRDARFKLSLQDPDEARSSPESRPPARASRPSGDRAE